MGSASMNEPTIENLLADELEAVKAENTRLRDQAGWTTDERLRHAEQCIKTLEFAIEGNRKHVQEVEAERGRLNAQLLNIAITVGEVLPLNVEHRSPIDALRWFAEKLADALRFKRWVHAFLDNAGVPKEFPDGKHTKEGCRIGDRMEWLKANGGKAK